MKREKRVLDRSRRTPKYLRTWNSESSQAEAVIFLKCFAFSRGGSRKQTDAVHVLVGFDPKSLSFGFRLVQQTEMVRSKRPFDQMIAEHSQRWSEERETRRIQAFKYRFQIDVGRAVKPVIRSLARLRHENGQHKLIDSTGTRIVGAVFSSRYKLPEESPIERVLQKEGIPLLSATPPGAAQLQRCAHDFFEHFQDVLGVFMRTYSGRQRSLEMELSRIGTGETRLIRRRLKPTSH